MNVASANWNQLSHIFKLDQLMFNVIVNTSRFFNNFCCWSNEWALLFSPSLPVEANCTMREQYVFPFFVVLLLLFVHSIPTDTLSFTELFKQSQVGFRVVNASQEKSNETNVGGRRGKAENEGKWKSEKELMNEKFCVTVCKRLHVSRHKWKYLPSRHLSTAGKEGK